ncbi:hypothetical protein ACF0H5_019509 [Mactra antiquata]
MQHGVASLLRRCSIEILFDCSRPVSGWSRSLSVLTLMKLFKIRTPAGAFFDVMLDYYKSDRSTTAAVFGLFTAINRGLGFPVGIIIQKFGITNVSLIGSILVPLGLFISLLASSIHVVLIGFGLITEDVVLTKFTNISEITHDVLPATDIVQSETYTGLQKIKDNLFGHFSSAFLCVLIASSLSLGTEYSFLALYIDILEFKGFSNQLALNAYLPLHIFALICRFVPGLSDKLNTIWLLAVFSICGATGQVVIMFSFNYYLSLFGVGLSGMTLGGVVAAGTIEVANTVSKTRFPVAFGQILTGSGLVATSVAPLYGALRDTWGNYDIVLASTAVLQFVSAILFVISKCCKTKYKPTGVELNI